MFVFRNYFTHKQDIFENNLVFLTELLLKSNNAVGEKNSLYISISIMVPIFLGPIDIVTQHCVLTFLFHCNLIRNFLYQILYIYSMKLIFISTRRESVLYWHLFIILQIQLQCNIPARTAVFEMCHCIYRISGNNNLTQGLICSRVANYIVAILYNH